MESFDIDFTDHERLVELMDNPKYHNDGYSSKNADGETVLVSISKEKISVRTYQDNGWMRINTYWRDGSFDETYDKSERESYGGRDNFLLVTSDGYSIDHSTYRTLEEAQEEMKSAFKSCIPKIWTNPWRAASYCEDRGAVLYAGRAVSFAWKIIEV